MNRLIWALVAILVLALPVVGQPSNPSVIPAAPPATCTAGVPLWSVFSTGTLYICNNGTPTAIGGGGGGGNLSGTLTAGKLPVATAAHTLGDSLADYGVTTAGEFTLAAPSVLNHHNAMGALGTVDGANTSYNWTSGASTAVLNILENSPIGGLTGIASEVDYAPTTSVSSATPPYAGMFSISADLDGQSGTSLGGGIVGLVSGVQNTSTTTALASQLIGMSAEADNINGGTVDHLWGAAFGSHNFGTGNIAVEEIGVISGSSTAGGTVNQLANFFGDSDAVSGGTVTEGDGVYQLPPAVTGGGAITTWASFHAAELGPLTSATTNQYGLLIDSLSGATNNWAIKTGTGLVELGDHLKLDSVPTTTQTSVLGIDSSGNVTKQSAVCSTCAIGPGSSTANHLAEFANTDGLTLKDGGAFPANKDQCGVGLYNGGAAITAATYTLNGRCLNAYGSTYTITGVQCYATASDSSTGNVSDSGSNALLTGVITPTAGAWVAGTQSATTTIASGVWTTWTIVAGGTSTAINCVMSLTHN